MNDRLTRLQGKLKEQGVNQLVLSYPSSIYYLTGQWFHPGKRLLALLVEQDGAKLIVNQLLPVQPIDGVEIVLHCDWDDWVGVLAQFVNDSGVVGLDMEWQVGFAFDLMNRKPHATFIDGRNTINALRMIKDAHEIELMRDSSRRNDEIMGRLIGTINKDLTEWGLAEHLYEYADDAGTDGFEGFACVSYGTNAVDAHHAADGTKLKAGDNIVMDIGFGYKKYRSDMTRTVFYKEPSAKMRHVYDTVLEANLSAIASIKPGVLFSDIDKVSRDIIDAAGYKEYYVHRVGHSIGLDVHEPPYVVGNNPTPVQPGMIFSIEPGVYIPEVGGVRIEDLVLVTDTGCEVLNKYPKELTIIE